MSVKSLASSYFSEFNCHVITSHPAISTAALDMLAGDVGVRMSRKPEIMADAAYLILTQNSRSYTGNFLIDDDVLRQHGVTDLDQYANVPGQFVSGGVLVCEPNMPNTRGIGQWNSN